MNPASDTTPQQDGQTPPAQPIEQFPPSAPMTQFPFNSEPAFIQPTQPAPQAADANTVTPQGQPGQPLPPAPKPKKQSYKKFFIIFASVLVAIGLGIAAHSIITSLISKAEDAKAAAISKDLPYQYGKPLLNISESDEVQFPVSYDMKQLDSYKKNNNYDDAIKVFTDSSFTHPANVNIFPQKDTITRLIGGKNDSKIRITPNASDLRAQQIYSTGRDPVTVSPSGAWGPNSEYYIVRYLDEKGAKLPKPVVTRMTVKKPLATPDVRTSVDGNGTVNFTWNQIDGAKSYLITKFTYKKSADGVIQKLDKAEVIGNTDKTSWKSSDQDPGANSVVASQNGGFKTFLNSEDNLHGKSIASVDLNNTSVEYGVVAANDPTGKDLYSTSGYTPINGDDLGKTVPYQLAENASKEVLSKSKDISTLPSALPVTLVNGSTVLLPVVIDTSKTEIKNGKLSVHFTVSGTNISNAFIVSSFNQATYTAEIQALAQRNIDTQQRTGSSLAYQYIEPRKTVENASKTRPDVPYTVNSSDEFSDYLAANMIAGNELIDVSKYIDSTSLSLGDVIYQVKYQNPYILGFKGYIYHPNEKVVEVSYAYNTQERADYQKKLSEKAKSVVASLITPGMSDRQKALALNNYLVNNASYNYTALNAVRAPLGRGLADTPQYRDNWSAVGILLDGSGVCQSYSDAFKLLADVAGLKAIVITGTVDGQGHAWNKVFMDGKWQNVDVTWDDNGDPNESTRLFGLTDAIINSQWRHVEDKYALIDSLIPTYAAN